MQQPPPPEENTATDELDPLEHTRMALWEHLDDLRKCIFRSLIAICVGAVITYQYSAPIMHFLELPLLKVLPVGAQRLVYTGIADKFMVYLKVSLISALFLVLPFVLFQLWQFISPALYPKERKFAGPFVIVGTLAFFTGLAFAYYVVIPFGYEFLIQFGNDSGPHSEQAMITLADYFSLTLKLLLAVGLIFETPVILIFLGRFGLVSSEMLGKFRKHAFLGSAVVAAVATPSPDAFTMLIVMVPLYFLYEIGIVGVRLTGKRG